MVILMKLNFVSTSDIDVSDNLNMMVYKVGESPSHIVLVIDDFLKNPENILSILENYCFDPESITHELQLKFPKIKKVFHSLSKIYHGIENIEESMFDEKIKLQLSLLNGGAPCLDKDIIPHIDPSRTSFSLFLNEDQESLGGIGFYKHKKSNLDYDISPFDEDFKKTEQYWHIHETYRKSTKYQSKTIFDSTNINEDDWALQFVADAKFNRLVMYPSYIFHSPYIEKDWYTEQKRLTLDGFVL